MFDELGRYLISWARGNYTPPYRIHFLPTNRCNLDCRSCWRWKYEKENKVPEIKEISEGHLMSLVKESAHLGVREWELSGGGEPLLRGRPILNMMNKIKSFNMRGKITTNGTLLNHNVSEKIVKMGWDQIMISLDGPNSEVNDKLRPPQGTFNKVVNNIKNINRLKEIHNKKKPTIAIVCVVSKDNVEALFGMSKLASKLRVQSLYFEKIKDFTHKCKPLLLENQDFEKIKEQKDSILEIAEYNNFNTNIDIFPIQPNSKCRVKKKDLLQDDKNRLPDKLGEFLSMRCFEPWYRLVINAKGETAPCCSVSTSPKENVKNCSLLDVWLGKYFSKFREKITSGKLLPVCENCSVCLSSHPNFLRKKILNSWKEDSNLKGRGLNNIRLLEDILSHSTDYFHGEIKQHKYKINSLKKHISKSKLKISELESDKDKYRNLYQMADTGYKAKNKELSDLYNSNGFKFILKPLWAFLGFIKNILKVR